MDAGLDKPVREWYAAMYPNDASVADIRPDMTFRDMLDEAVPYGDLAGEIIDLPPVVRDRVLDEISVRSGVPYAQVAEGFDPEEMSVRWFGANRGEPSLMDMLTDLTEFKQGALAELPGLAEAATWRDFSDADVEVQKAAWAMDLGGGRQAVAECHLTEDDDSPWGYGFYFAGFTFDPDEGEWVEQDGGLFWGYRSADDPELTIEVLGSCGVSFEDGDFARVDYGVLRDCGVFGGAGRPLTHEELSPAAPDDGPGGCDLDLEAGDAREARDAVNGPAERAGRDLGER